MLSIDLTGATASRVAALDFAIGVEWIEQVLNIMVNLLIEGYTDHCLRYLKFTQDKKEELIEEIATQVQEAAEIKSWFGRQKNTDKAADEIYKNFLRQRYHRRHYRLDFLNH